MGPSKDESTNRKTESSHPSINIIGAGIAGLSLACHLRRRRINFNIFDAASKPKGHNYGISISPHYYNDLLPTLEPKFTSQSFREAVAVDRRVGGHGIITPPSNNNPQTQVDDLRASDSSLRDILAQGHKINWNHKLISAEQVPQGLKLNFENGHASTANITIDAGGERSTLSSLIQVPDQKPKILPYAVYHGSRYIPQAVFDDKFKEIFLEGSNVRNFPPSSQSNRWHLQIAKAHVSRDQVSSRVDLTLHSDSEPNADDPIVEFRYTLSRPSTSTSTSTPDTLFNPNRDTHEAKTTPPAFFDEVSTYLANSRATLPDHIHTLLNPSILKQDRILNWLLRLHPARLDKQRLETLAASSVVAIGDAVHAMPPLGSRGASLAMGDAMAVVDWVEPEEQVNWESRADRQEKVLKFYGGKVGGWNNEVDGVERMIERLHAAEEKLSGRI